MDQSYARFQAFIEQDLCTSEDWACAEPSTVERLCQALYGELGPVWTQFWPSVPSRDFATAQLPSAAQLRPQPGLRCHRILQRNDAIYCCR
jgi:hypothetical protein